MPSIKKYIALDTNSLVCFLENGFLVAQQTGYKEPEDIKVLQNLLRVLDANKAEIIIPEVIILEIKRISEEKKASLENIYNNAIKSVQETTQNNKKIAQRSFDKIQKNMLAICQEEIQENDKVISLLQKIYDHKNAHIVELDHRILVSSYKRELLGKKPFVMRFSNTKDPVFNNKPVHDIQPDCVIVESLRSFLKRKRKFEFYLCTNDSNFFVSTEKKQLDPSIQKELNVKEFFLSPAELLDKTFGVKAEKKKDIEIKEDLSAFPLVEKSQTEEGKTADKSDVVKG